MAELVTGSQSKIFKQLILFQSSGDETMSDFFL